mmetsp:Transcript_28448/g.51410  ORF Transcript_28448/g.51410 Transcript_28448/m.51410 type:complete len:297 (+) Transcript_28448:81-971(+)
MPYSPPQRHEMRHERHEMRHHETRIENEDHQDQMALGIRIITTAFQKKVDNLETEIKRLKLTCEEQKANVASLQRKNSALEVELVESHQRSQQLADENKELFKTVGSLRKQIARLESLKQAVMYSMQDDQAQEAELGDAKVLMSDDFLTGVTPLTAAEMGYGPPTRREMMDRTDRQMSPSRPEQQGYRQPEAPPMQAYQFEPAAAERQQPFSREARPSAPSASPSSPVVDGKAFFRHARSRLSYEAFNLFLASIKRLNNQQQTREETLDEARRIFGAEMADLYKDFEALLNRHGML